MTSALAGIVDTIIKLHDLSDPDLKRNVYDHIDRQFAGNPALRDSARLRAKIMMNDRLGKTLPGPIIAHRRELSESDWKVLIRVDPDLVRTMIKQRYTWKGYIRRSWFSENCTGLYYLRLEQQEIAFASEEDAMLFKLKFDQS